MAYVDPNQDQQQGQGQAQAPAGNGPQAPSTSGAVGGASTAQAYSPTAATSGTQGTGFQNLQNYLTANQGSNLSNQVAGDVQNTANKAQSEYNTAQTGFNQAVDQNTVKTDQNNVNSVLANPQNASAADTTAFQNQLNANYGGPTSSSQYAPWQQAQSDANTAYTQSQQATTDGGKMSLLNNYFGNPTYSQGQQSLDSALMLGGDQSGFNNLQNQVQNIQSQFQTTGNTMDQYANQAAAQTAATRQNARNAIGIDNTGNLLTATTPSGQQQLNAYGQPVYQGAIGNIENAVNNQLGADQTTLPAEYAQVQAALASGNLTGLSPAELSALGPLATYTGSLYSNPQSPLNLQSAGNLTQNAINPTADNVITSDQQAQLQALYGLAGVQNLFTPNATPGVGLDPFSYQGSNALSQIQQNQAAYNKALNSAAPANPDGLPSSIVGGNLPQAIQNEKAWLASPTQQLPGNKNSQQNQQVQATLAADEAQQAALDKAWGVNNKLKGA